MTFSPLIHSGLDLGIVVHSARRFHFIITRGFFLRLLVGSECVSRVGRRLLPVPVRSQSVFISILALFGLDISSRRWLSSGRVAFKEWSACCCRKFLRCRFIGKAHP